MVSISNGTAAEMAEQADRHSRTHRQLKLFLTNRDVLSMVSAIREAAPNCDLIIDAAESWDCPSSEHLAQLGAWISGERASSSG
jgi:L-alanine-DL-glutamate epimerase-like enolase superfamily enzyme